MNRRQFIHQIGIAGALVGTPRALAAEREGGSTPLGERVGAASKFSGIGVNYFDLFQRLLRKPGDLTHLENLRRLKKNQIPFARFACCGFWPVDWELYLRNRGDYFRRLDHVINAAEKAELGLIASLFWLYSAVPDLAGEPMRELGNPRSKSVEFVRNYTREVVSRYKNSAAIWGWELGNEYNLVLDLPNAATQRPPVHPTLKTASSRSDRDELRSSDFQTLCTEFGRAVRQNDSNRLLITGNAAPRPSAWHNSHDRSWKQDSPEQFEEVLLRDNPGPFNTLSIHLYPEKVYPGGKQSVDKFIEASAEAGRRLGKPLFVGEFGASRGEEGRLHFQQLLRALVRNEVPLAALWVYDFPGQEKDWNITFENDRSFMLEMIGKANVQIKEARKL